MLRTSIPDCDSTALLAQTSGRPLLSVDEACAIARAMTGSVERIDTLDPAQAMGRILACDVGALIDLPPFDQSAMDGFALSGEGSIHRLSALAPVGAGTQSLKPGHARKIVTGGRLPSGADRVVMHEHARLRGTQIIMDGFVPAGNNIRWRGEDVRKGDVLLCKGARIDALIIALLCAQGISGIEVLAQPRVAVMSTGSELKQPGEALGAANVYDSNRPMLMALAAEAGAQVTDGGCWPDDLNVLSQAFSGLAETHDLVVVSGGSSIGEPDLAVEALAQAGADMRHLKIAMKPGKPAVVGRLGAASMLVLPGNPGAAFVSWFVLGRCMMNAMLGGATEETRTRNIRVSNTLRRKRGRAQFAPVRIVQSATGEQAEFLGKGGSAALKPLSLADGFARVDAERGDVLAGEQVTFFPMGTGLR